MSNEYRTDCTACRANAVKPGQKEGCIESAGKKWLVPKLALLNYLYKSEGREGLQPA